MQQAGRLLKLVLAQSAVLVKAEHRTAGRCPEGRGWLLHTGPARLSCPAMPSKQWAEWQFSEPLLASLPLDREPGGRVRYSVQGAVFSLTRPTAWRSPAHLVAASADALALLDLQPGVVECQDWVEWVAGSNVLPDSTPMAHR